MHADRTNRVMLGLLGLVAAAAGVVELLVAHGVFGSLLQHETLFANRVSRWIGGHGTLVWAVVAAVGFVVVLLCLRWLLALLVSTDRTSDIEVHAQDKKAGSTVLRAAAVLEAVLDEVGGYRGVEQARGRMIGDAEVPELVLLVTAGRRTDLPALRDRIETEAVAHVRTATDRPDLKVRLRLDIAKATSTRVDIT